MKKRLRFLLMAFCLIFLGQCRLSYAQNPQTIEVGPHFGASSYIGELNVWRNLDQWQWKQFNQFHYDWGVLARYNYDSRWSFRIDYTHGKVRACDSIAAWRPDADLNFQSTVNDLSLMVEFNFLDYYTGHVSNVISPYIFGGVSGFMFETKPFTKNLLIDEIPLQAQPTEAISYSKYSLSVPFGLGCKMSLSKHLATTVEWRMHYTFTDYLDDVSGLYPDDDKHVLLISNAQGKPDLIAANPSNLDANIAMVYDFTDPSGQFSANQQRGNTQTNDWFGFINLSLTWKFVIPNRSSCKMNID